MGPETLYRKLQRHLDRMPIGFPATESGVEIRLLQRLFTPEEAEIALALSAIPEPAGAIHKRLKEKLTLDALKAALDEMALKGVLLRLPARDQPLYAKMVFAIGMMERQLKRLTPEFIRDAEQYSREGFSDAFHSRKTTQLRTVPVNKTIGVERGVAAYEDIRQHVETSDGPFAAMDCFCRKAADLKGEPCRQTKLRENCLTIGPAARMVVENKMARFVSKEDMLGLIDAAESEGLVLQPENTKSPLFVCCCCGCCCGVLKTAKRFERPAEYFSANFYAEPDPERCLACGTCEARCQMDAIRCADGKTEVDRVRCIGCGLCVTTCASDAMQLKQTETKKVPPDNSKALYLQLLHQRYGPIGMAAIAAKKMLGMKI